jgi:hypothetical protein
VAIKATTVNANAIIIMVLTDFLSDPKIMGIGPIMTTPAACTLLFLALPRETRIIAATMIMIPAMINAKLSP